MKLNLTLLKPAAFLVIVLTAVLPAMPQGDPRERVVVTEGVTKTVSGSPTVSSALPAARTRISSILARSALRRGSVGVKIISLDSGEVVYERDAEKYFMPASNMKSFTVAAALDSLGPDYRFVTSVYAAQKPGSDGVVKGDLIVFGRGDPSFSWRFSDGDWYAAIDRLADEIIAAGVRRIEGNLIGDDSFHKGVAVPSGWELDDLQWYYGAEVSALTVNDNVVVMKVKPGAEGEAPEVTFEPSSGLFRVINSARTVKPGEPKTFAIEKKTGENVYEVSGAIPQGDPGFSGPITISRPAEVFADLLKQRLELKGVITTGRTVGSGRKAHGGKALDASDLVEIVAHPSPPLSIIAQNVMKPSQNLYTELLLRSMGEIAGDRSSEMNSDEKGMAIIKTLLAKAGIAGDSIVQHDGSGLSRHNLITPNASAMLYKYLDSVPYAVFWRNSLTIGGVDGTLRNRFKGTGTTADIRGKTGTLDQVSALSGYVTSKAGEKFAFSVITNGIPSSSLRVSTIDEIVLSLAGLEEKTYVANEPAMEEVIQ